MQQELAAAGLRGGGGGATAEVVVAELAKVRTRLAMYKGLYRSALQAGGGGEGRGEAGKEAGGYLEETAALLREMGGAFQKGRAA